jgi:hypothetical protein
MDGAESLFWGVALNSDGVFCGAERMEGEVRVADTPYGKNPTVGEELLRFLGLVRLGWVSSWNVCFCNVRLGWIRVVKMG